RRQRPEYQRLYRRIRKLQEDGAPEEILKPLLDEFRTLRSNDPFDPSYKRLRYIRSADDFLLGLIGPREEAEKIKVQLREYLRDHLKLELSPEKTLITPARTEPARFFGYEITTQCYPGRLGNGRIQLRIPSQVIEEKIARYSHEGKPVHRPELIYDSDFSIV